MHFYKTPRLAKRLFPGLIWEVPTKNQEVFLTFDDGPVPGVTDWVLDYLKEKSIKATVEQCKSIRSAKMNAL